MSVPWHADDDALARYVRGGAGLSLGASLEQHLTQCANCRGRLATHVEAPFLELAWDRIRDQVQAPARSAIERSLTRLGVPEPDALLVAVAPSLRVSWLFGLAATLAFVALSAGYGGSHGLTVFLLVAPLVPVAGVAVAYGPDVDPSYEIGVATPYSAARLLILRSAGVLTTCLPLVVLAAVSVPALPLNAVAWLVPALSFTAVLLAAATWTRPTYAAAALGIGWVAIVGATALDRDPAAVLEPALLLVYAAIGLLAALVLRRRIRHLAFSRSLS